MRWTLLTICRCATSELQSSKWSLQKILWGLNFLENHRTHEEIGTNIPDNFLWLRYWESGKELRKDFHKAVMDIERHQFEKVKQNLV